jgi:ppGpp synthetase/RelA/SpoT-type nucleotidyltranferase
MALTRSQIERLGVRLVATAQPTDEDLALLHELLLTYNSTLRGAVARVRNELGLLPTSRIKNTGTILEKLERHGGSWLKSIQDIAGMRITGSFDLAAQDALVAQIVSLFAVEQRAPRVIDRRAAPMHGYRAVHVVAYPDRIPLEIQVRTSWQHEWAELFEKLADAVGREIRYGDPAPTYPVPAELSTLLVEQATTISRWIAAVEQIATLQPDDPELENDRIEIESSLRRFGEHVARLRTYARRPPTISP